MRGEGDAEGETLLRATGKQQRSLLKISGEGNYVEDQAKAQMLEAIYIPVGSKYVVVDDSRDFQKGASVLLSYELNAAWIKAVKMDQIIAREGTKQWTTKEYKLKFERVISSISGDTLFLDNPVVMAIDPQFGKVSVVPFKFTGRIQEVGVENLRFESEFANETDENHAWIAIEFDKIENAWVRNITARYFGYAAVSLGAFAKQTSVINSKCLDPKSQITGDVGIHSITMVNSIYLDNYIPQKGGMIMSREQELWGQMFLACPLQRIPMRILAHIIVGQ
ncbi:hypothetical protein KUH03_04435 [Sphingobacterium sp. E70]|uniref:hypothetical protein n=1 Tax=Sphingobacterium sp. E70 TaxID=2853439 RepID=UPI00211CF1A7|nr:hypothetical protein [Sphingobacterium sp. E70]ULT26187.1 hypothetical protein KUH03_04435 [Sphingobacterium sp. E70]